MSDVPLDDAEVERYARQIVLREVGPAGQRRLRDAAVCVVGAGGLGSPVLLYLAAAGVGRLTVVDDDRVALDNLQRQVLHDSRRIGEPKAEVAVERLGALNPQVRVRGVERRLDAGNAATLLRGHDVVVEGSDSIATKLTVSDACVALRIPAVVGAVLRFEGQVLVSLPQGPCYRCLVGDAPAADAVPACSAAGILGPVVGVVGSLQASETLRLLLGLGEPPGGRLLLFDALRPGMRRVALPTDPRCTACGAAAGVAG